ncbi:hypothetical protein SASPL_126708 [Salvia splendens]|uniref:Uncharacterized protein n=1 Tax=Salvia splendens TaxID=180675 RepID=A0A8X8XJH3_SALSN|nr:hypothetical protein SASPL_126708 [Salvia splendens]
MDDVKLEHSTEVIVLSDDTEKLPSESSLFVAGPFDEEVNSPVTFPRGLVRRKLFDEELPTMDMESSTKCSSNGPSQAKSKEGRTYRKPPPHMLASAGQLYISPKGSCCCSYSPIGGLPHLHK